MAHQHDDERIPLSQVEAFLPRNDSPAWRRLLAGIDPAEKESLTRALRRARERGEISLRHADQLLTAAGHHLTCLPCWEDLMQVARDRAGASKARA